MRAYVHYRTTDEDGFPLSKGGATVAIEYLDDSRESILVAVSECSMKDNFDKSIGRSNADLRMIQFRDGEYARFVYIFPRIKKMKLKENMAYFMFDYFAKRGLY